MRVAYADPPYPGCAHLYKDHPDYAGEVDHEELFVQLKEYDGWVLHTSSPALADVITAAYCARVAPFRIMAWVKPFAAFKANVSVAYAWEPVLVKACRKPVVDKSMVWRDWVAEPITLQRGLTGAKPERVCHWAFNVLGMEPDDELVDLFPGSGAVTRAWESWRNQQTLFSTASSQVPPEIGGTVVHILAPDTTWIRRIIKCPTCERRRRFVGMVQEWYDTTWTCCACGDAWAGSERLPRPFMRGWRTESAEAAKRHWRAP